jgi:ABC-type lipoprotein release transport system permease subunit
MQDQVAHDAHSIARTEANRSARSNVYESSGGLADTLLLRKLPSGIMRQSLLVAAVGLAIGAAGAAAGTRVVASLLYDLPSRDPATLAGAAAMMLAVSAVAGYLPARRASRVDPLVALRHQ